MVCALPCVAQTPSAAAKPDQTSKAAAYYHVSLGHLYSELAGAYPSKGEYLDKAIDNFREALKADPGASFIAEELANLYIRAGRLREAVEDAETAIKKNPDDVNSRKILARIYTRLIGDPRQNKINEEMLGRAIEQYAKLSELLPEDHEIWLTLGRLQKVAQDSVASERAYKKVLEIEPDHEDALLGLAMVYSDLGDQPRAAEMLRRVVASNPSVRTLTALAGSYQEQREYALAAATFQSALQLSPGNTNIKRALAESLFLAEKLDESLQAFRELAEEDPSDYRSQLRLSQIHRQKKEYDKAREALDKAKQTVPDNLELRYHEVNLLESEDKTEQAIEVLEQILEDTKKDSYGRAERANRVIFLERLGLMYRASEQFEDAVRVFRQLAELDPELAARVAAQIGDTYRLAKEFNKAAEVIEAAHKKHPDDNMVSVVRATVLADLGQADAAVASIEKLMEGRKDLNSYLTRAQIYEKAGRYDAVADAIDAALKIASADEEKATLLFMQGAMHERTKRYRKAEAAFRKVLDLNPDNASAMNYLGYMFADRNVRIEEAHELITKALEKEPHNGAYLDSLGWVYYRMDRLEEAAEHLQRAVEKVSRDPVVHDHLGDVYFRQGKLKEAITHWKISLKEWALSSAGEQDQTQVAKISKKLERAEVRQARESSTRQPK